MSWGSFLPKIIVPVVTGLIGRKVKEGMPQDGQEGFASKFFGSMAGKYVGDNAAEMPKFSNVGSGGGSIIEAKINAIQDNLRLANFKENFYGNSALDYLSNVMRADQMRKSNTVDIGHRTASTKTSISPSSPTIRVESSRLG